MKGFIKRLLREAMVSQLSHWKENLSRPEENIITTLISKDDENNDKLYLFVGFRKYPTLSEYSYSFMLVDNNNKPKTGYMTKRSEVAKYIPEDIKNKRQIFPIIKDMTREVLDSYLPQNIFRETAEPIDGDSLKRYEEITQIMINEYGYKLIKTEKTPENTTKWWLSKENNTDNNKDMNESYMIHHQYSTQEKMKALFDPILPRLAEMNLKPIFTGIFPINKKTTSETPIDDDDDDWYI